MKKVDEAHGCSPFGDLMHGLELQPRVYIKEVGGDYTEIVGIQSFQRCDDDDTEGKMIFFMHDGHDGAINGFLQNAADKYVSVRMELLIGMLMVITFSGFVESVSGNTICIELSTPITTDVLDVVQ